MLTIRKYLLFVLILLFSPMQVVFSDCPNCSLPNLYDNPQQKDIYHDKCIFYRNELYRINTLIEFKRRDIFADREYLEREQMRLEALVGTYCR